MDSNAGMALETAAEPAEPAKARLGRPKGSTAKAQAGKRAAFLAVFAESGVIAVAARQCGVTAQTVGYWRNTDRAFALAMLAAYDASTDRLEHAAYGRALEKSDPLAMFMLKGRRRTVYGDKQELTGRNGQAIEIIVKRAADQEQLTALAETDDSE